MAGDSRINWADASEEQMPDESVDIFAPAESPSISAPKKGAGIKGRGKKGKPVEPPIEAYQFIRKQPNLEIPCQNPRYDIPLWRHREEFCQLLRDSKVIIAKCPTASGKSTILPMLCAQYMNPREQGRIMCTQIRRGTTEGVRNSTCRVWGVDLNDKFIGYRHGTQKTEAWDAKLSKILYLTEGIVMRQVLSHDDSRSREILHDCRMLLLDEVHTGSPDVELILARVLPKIKHLRNFRLVLMSATLNIDRFIDRMEKHGYTRDEIGVFTPPERLRPLANFCLSREQYPGFNPKL